MFQVLGARLRGGQSWHRALATRRWKTVLANMRAHGIVRFGLQLEDVESAIGETLAEKPIYVKLMDFIKDNPPEI